MKSWRKVKFGTEVYYYCPRCKTQYEFNKGETPNTTNYRFCPFCGIRLNWKDNEEDLYTEEEEEELWNNTLMKN